VALAGLSSPNPMITHVKGMVVYNTATTTDLTPGYYYNDGSKWVAAKLVEPWKISGTTDMATLNTDNIYQMGQVTIGSAELIDPTAALRVVASNKGVLLPQVNLTAHNDKVTIPNPTTGLLVYNTGVGGLQTKGYLYWNGEEWIQFSTGTSKAPEIAGLDCTNARIVPSRYEKDVPYEGVLIVPYMGGNGGYYASNIEIESTGVEGLTATLQPGNLAYGNGDLVFTLSGTPNESSPELATFDIDVLGFNCQSIVGSNSLMQGEQVFWYGSLPANIGSVIASQYINNMPVIEDVFRLDAYFSESSTGETTVSYRPRIYNISNDPVKFWWGGVTSIEGRGRSNVLLASGGYQNLDNGMYMGYGQNMREGGSTPAPALDEGSTSQETMTIDVFYLGKWYRVFFTGWVDNKNSTNTSLWTRELYISYQRLY